MTVAYEEQLKSGEIFPIFQSKFNGTYHSGLEAKQKVIGRNTWQKLCTCQEEGGDGKGLQIAYIFPEYASVTYFDQLHPETYSYHHSMNLSRI